MQPRPQLWFERMFRAFGLGVLGGSLIVGGGGFTLLTIFAYFFSGAPSSFFLETNFAFVPVAFLLIALVNYGSALVASKIEDLKEYAASMTQEGKSAPISRLYSLKVAMLVVLIAEMLTQPVYIFTVLPGSLSLFSRLIVSIPYFYWGFYLGSFFWVFAYSLYGVYKLGRLPLNLRPFTEDGTLGLRPFGRVSLLLAAIYLAMVTILIIPQIILGIANLSVVLFTLALLIQALVLFLLPLVPLRAKLLRTKREVLDWIGPRYTRAVESLRAAGEAPVDAALVNELIAVDKIQRDAHQIHTWPFDTSLIIRLAAVILTVVGIVIARVVQLALKLAT